MSYHLKAHAISRQGTDLAHCAINLFVSTYDEALQIKQQFDEGGTTGEFAILRAFTNAFIPGTMFKTTLVSGVK